MKPQILTMNAFGPYGNKCVIDFRKFNDKGLFLITGDTGSGKTTIFDGICYALYGEVSGGKNKKDAKSLRSDYADKSEKTYVEFQFEHKGKIYEIKRNPEYIRIVNNKEKKETAAVELFEIIGETKESIASSTKVVNNKIIEIVGFDLNQFSQTVMIAQGDFMKIINSSSDERRKLLQKIFNTDIYSKIQEELSNRNSELKKQYEQFKVEYDNSCKHLVDIVVDNENRVENISNIIKELEETNKNDEKELNKNIKEKNKLDIEKEELFEEINNIKNNNKIIADLKNLKQDKIDKIDKKKSEIEKKEKELNLALKANVVKEVYDNLLNNQKQIDSNKNKLEVINKSLSDLKEKIDKIDFEKQDKEYQLQISKIEKENENLEKVKKLISEKEEYEKELTKKINNKNLKNEVYQKANEVYQQANDIFFKNEYGIIASSLIDGKPCPICGSVHHPDKAKVSENNTVDQNTLKKLEKKKNEAQQELSDAESNLKVSQSKLKDCLNRINELNIDDSFSCGQIEEKIKQNNQDKSITQQEYNNFKSDYQKNNESYQNYNGEKKQLEDREKSLINENNSLKLKYEETIKNENFKSESDYQNSLRSAKEIETLRNEINQYHSDGKSLIDRINLLENQLTNKREIDVSKRESKLNEIRTSINSLVHNNTELNTKLTANKKEYDILLELEKKINNTLKEYNVVNSLYTNISGQKVGTKITFETYVQQYFFQQVIVAANRRLKVLTNDNFTLNCKKQGRNNRSQTGLDLEVFDSQTQTYRDVSTLSGGESFLASLSMALGLSDVVSSSSGQVRIDAMFIDEGFGSLSSDVLNQAIKLLDSLTEGNKLIGIISHVDTLRDRIDNKIVIKKGNNGSSAQIICTD